jgi:hypothetical protein
MADKLETKPPQKPQENRNSKLPYKLKKLARTRKVIFPSNFSHQVLQKNENPIIRQI